MDSKTTTIFRTIKRDNPYVQIDKTVINDIRLSWKAKGLMAFLLSKPNDWIININNLVKQAKDGRDSVYAAIKELRQLKYLQQIQSRDCHGRILGYEYLVYENPRLYEQDLASVSGRVKNEIQIENPSSTPLPGNPYTALPYTENPTLLNNDLILNNDLTKDPPSYSPNKDFEVCSVKPDLLILEPIAFKLFGQSNDEILEKLWLNIQEFKLDSTVVEECLNQIDISKIKFSPYGYFRGIYALSIAVVTKRIQGTERQRQLEELINEQEIITLPLETKSTEEIIAEIKRTLGISKTAEAKETGQNTNTH